MIYLGRVVFVGILGGLKGRGKTRGGGGGKGPLEKDILDGNKRGTEKKKKNKTGN